MVTARVAEKQVKKAPPLSKLYDRAILLSINQSTDCFKHTLLIGALTSNQR